MGDVFFWIFAILALVMGFLSIVRRRAMSCALSLVVSFVALSGVYVTLKAPFPAMLQIILYAGAIMVLVVFVIMFLNAPEQQEDVEEISKPGAVTAVFLLLPVAILLLGVIWGTSFPDAPRLAAERATDAAGTLSADFGTANAMGRELFSNYLYPFEILSILILAAMTGAVLVAKKRLD
jgi:NADH-quinone oxidoreductase subunit J